MPHVPEVLLRDRPFVDLPGACADGRLNVGRKIDKQVLVGERDAQLTWLDGTENGFDGARLGEIHVWQLLGGEVGE